MSDLSALSARALAKAIRDKKVSSVEATKFAIAGLEACHTLTNCTIALEAEEALAAAKAADAAIAAGTARGALAGVPLAHKDMFDRKGKISSWGARIRAEQPAVEDATVIARFKAAGALQVAALHLTEFAFGPTGHNYVLGHARNPWDPTRITGGSSAGTACSVAYGAIPAGLGSDTGGSLRLPAACCGIASIKPTWGRVSRAGLRRGHRQEDEQVRRSAAAEAVPDHRERHQGAERRRDHRRDQADPKARADRVAEPERLTRMLPVVQRETVELVRQLALRGVERHQDHDEDRREQVEQDQQSEEHDQVPRDPAADSRHTSSSVPARRT